MLIKRPLTQFEKVGLFIIGPIILLVLALSLAVAGINLLAHRSERRDEVHVGNIASSLISPVGCSQSKIEKHATAEVFGTSHGATVTYSCKDVSASNVIKSIQANLASQQYDNLVYSELDKKPDYPDVRASFTYSQNGEGGPYVGYELQNQASQKLSATDRSSLDQLQVYVVVAKIST